MIQIGELIEGHSTLKKADMRTNSFTALIQYILFDTLNLSIVAYTWSLVPKAVLIKPISTF